MHPFIYEYNFIHQVYPIYLSISSICQAIYLHVYLYLSISIYLYLSISISISIYLSIYLSIYIHIHIYTYLSIYLSLSLYTYVYMYIYIYIYIYRLTLCVAPGVFARAPPVLNRSGPGSFALPRRFREWRAWAGKVRARGTEVGYRHVIRRYICIVYRYRYRKKNTHIIERKIHI